VVLGRRHDEDDVGWRFLQRLQERVEGGVAEHVDFIDDEDLVPVARRTIAHLLDEFAYVVHPRV